MSLQALLLLPAARAYSCAVCFGKGDNPGLVSGLTWGLFILIGATFVSVAWLTAAMVRMEKRKAAADQLAL